MQWNLNIFLKLYHTIQYGLVTEGLFREGLVKEIQWLEIKLCIQFNGIILGVVVFVKQMLTFFHLLFLDFEI